MTIFNEDSRIRIPALLHPGRQGYRYLSPKGRGWGPTELPFVAKTRSGPTSPCWSTACR